MKSHRSSSKSGLFLIELIIAIVFFAVASAICMQLFVNAHLTSAQSQSLSAANAILQTEADSFKSGIQPVTVELGDPGGTVAYYNETGTKTDSADAAYRVTCRLGDDDGLSTATYSVYRVHGMGKIEIEKGEAPIAELTVAAYDQENR